MENAESYLVIEIVKTENPVVIKQENYEKKILQRFDMAYTRPMKTPIANQKEDISQRKVACYI